MWTPPPHWPDVVTFAHLGGVPELLTILIPVLLFVIVRKIQFRREQRREAEEEQDPAEEGKH